LVLLICVDGWIGGCWLRRLPLAEYQRQLLQVSSIPFGPHPWLVDVNIVDPSTICSGCRLDSVTRGCCPSHSIRYLLVPNTTAYHTILRILFHLPGLFLLSCVFGILSCRSRVPFSQSCTPSLGSTFIRDFAYRFPSVPHPIVCIRCIIHSYFFGGLEDGIPQVLHPLSPNCGVPR